MYTFVVHALIACSWTFSVIAMEVSNKQSSENGLVQFAQDVTKGSLAGSCEAVTGRPLGNYMLNMINKNKPDYVPRTPYQGLGSHLFCVIPSTAFQIGVESQIGNHIENKDVSSLSAGAFSVAVVAPSDNIVINQQPNESLKETMQRIHKQSGIKGFYKGASSVAKKEALFTWGYIAGKQKADEFVEEHITDHWIGTKLISTGLCSLILAPATQPLNNIAIWQQYGMSSSYKDTFKKMKAQGLFKGLMAGGVPRFFRYWTALSMISCVKDACDSYSIKK